MDALIALPSFAVLLSPSGELNVSVNAQLLKDKPVLVCHARLTAERLGVEKLNAADILELFAFVRPGQFCVPTVRGLSEALALEVRMGESAALTLYEARDKLLDELAEAPNPKVLANIAAAMQKGGWAWSEAVLQALAVSPETEEVGRALAVWAGLPEWEDMPPPLPAGNESVSQSAARARLAEIVARAKHAEPRPEQSDYASAVSEAFAAPEALGPNVILAEAGTGVGKTLGYLAPASLWAEANGAPVWVSTYTRNLQRQIESQAALLPDAKVVVRKGRENYLCLLNYEEAVRGSFASPHNLVALGLVARWIQATKDGDIRGGTFPGWLADLLGRGRTLGLADRRGECIFAACPHYRKCFIERSVRATRGADVVIANHALVMAAAATGGIDEISQPTRFVFDEGHHLFHAADSAYGIDLSGAETADLRKWILGGEGKRKGRVRGLFKRAEPLLPNAGEGMELLEAIKNASAILPGEGWAARIARGETKGVTEKFLNEVRLAVQARDTTGDKRYVLETAAKELPAPLIEAAMALRAELATLEDAVKKLRGMLLARLENEAATLEGDIRTRLTALCKTLESFVLVLLSGWRAALMDLSQETPPDYFDWLQYEEGADAALCRRWRDPMKPFALAISEQAQGIVVTSATLTDPVEDGEARWNAAETDSGASYFPAPAVRAVVPSPFDYAKQTRVLIVNDIEKKNEEALGAAYRELFLASGGGGLGLFTSIERLKRAHKAIAPALMEAGLPLYAQHVDGLDPTTLVDIFRAEGNACLLGTDAVRDGVDVPGRALRLIVFEKVPWPRTDLLLKARKETFGGAAYIERLTRQKLRQAFGRLIRRADDHGVFVLLSPLPGRLYSAFPEGVRVEKVSLSEAIAATRAFLAEKSVVDGVEAVPV